MSKKQLENLETIDADNLATAQGGAGQVGGGSLPPGFPTPPFPFPRPSPRPGPGGGRPCLACGLG